MMKYIGLPDNKVRRLSFYLAMEEFVARHVDAPDCFFMWQVEPSVIFGRNQLIENEVNLAYCREHGIKTYRRKSGGGCVYADMNNVMFSYITREENVNFTFNRYINMVVLVLRKLGVKATASGRNDILVDGKKVSGNAFYHIPGRSIVHGTMLYDTDMQNMVGSITPSDEKLLSKGVDSVRQHITLLKDYINIGVDEFKQFVRDNLCTDEVLLCAEDIAQIELIEREYLTDEFIYGRNPHYTVVRKRRIEGVGDIEARLELKNGVIKKANLLGDFFITGELDKALLDKLKNVSMSRNALEEALPARLGDVIMNLKREDFVSLLLDEQLDKQQTR